jgi:hypothetical protein
LIFWKIKKPVNQGLTGLCFNVRAVWTGLEKYNYHASLKDLIYCKSSI